jgi:hypothetical protein
MRRDSIRSDFKNDCTAISSQNASSRVAAATYSGANRIEIASLNHLYKKSEVDGSKAAGVISMQYLVVVEKGPISYPTPASTSVLVEVRAA